MILPFSKKFKNGNDTHFLEKIWANQNLWSEEDAIYFSTNNPRILDFDDWYIETAKPKIHTIRRDEKNRWKTGNKIHPVFENRSKNQHQFAPTFICTGIQKIKILRSEDKMLIYVDGNLLDKWATINRLVQNDGFENEIDFCSWFDADFEGKIIHFTDLHY